MEFLISRKSDEPVTGELEMTSGQMSGNPTSIIGLCREGKNQQKSASTAIPKPSLMYQSPQLVQVFSGSLVFPGHNLVVRNIDNS